MGLNGIPITYGELLRWIGILLFMSTISGCKRRDFWSSKPITLHDGAPYRFHEWMSSRRYELILSHLTYTDQQPPFYIDRFWEIRTIIQEWNLNMAQIFKPSWVSCLDESMSIWFNKWTCPGWMFVPRKPHPFGNEYHTICCSLSRIMFAMEIVEGKDKPHEKAPCPLTGNKTPTVGLMLRLCRNLFSTGKVVILDSGFCVLEGICQLKKMGVFASAVIKKRRYWPKHVKGDKIDSHMKTKAVGECDALHGTLDGVKYNIFSLKEPNYVMKLMSTYGGLIVKPNERTSKRVYFDEQKQESVTVSFQYTEPFSNHYLYRHSVDDNNNLRHQLPSIEDTWKTQRWANRVFAFIIAVTEVNCYLAFKYFLWEQNRTQKIPTLHEFRRDLALKLIFNDFLKAKERRRSKRTHTHEQVISIAHHLKTAPPHAKKYYRGSWSCTASKRYQQYTCRSIGCKTKVRTFCACQGGSWMCQPCHSIHVAAEASKKAV